MNKGVFYQSRNEHLTRFREAIASSMVGESVTMDLRPAASSNPRAFLAASSAIQDEVSIYPARLLTTTAETAIRDLGLSLSAQAGGDYFRMAREVNQAELRELQSERDSLEIVLEREMAGQKQDYLHALIRWSVYNMWPYLLILALSLKLARTAQD